MNKPRINQLVLNRRIERIENRLEDYTPKMIENLLSRLQKVEERLFTVKDVLTTEEAAEYTGLSLSQLYKLTCSKKIPHYKPRGKMVYFDKRELDNWMRQNEDSLQPQSDDHAQ